MSERTMASPASSETLREALRHLPETTAPRLEAAGVADAALRDAGLHGAAPRSLGAVIVSGGVGTDADLPRALAAVRAALAPEGRLVWTGSSDDCRRLRVALPEAGFVVQRRGRDGPPGCEVLVARPDAFAVRTYKDGDEDHILELFEASFHVRRSRERWAWEYRDGPHGSLRISQAFDADGRLVAHYAGYPVYFHRAGTNGPARLLAQQIGDTMTARQVRHIGRGPTSLLGRTVGHFYARFCEGQVAFNYGFNTANIQKFSLRFVEARKVEPVAFAVREAARPWPRPGRLDWARRWRVEKVASFDARFDELFHRVRDAYGVLIERDARYLSWRYARCPDGGYATYAVSRAGRLVGWGTFRPLGDRLVWGDALFDPAEPRGVFRVLQRAALEHPQAVRIEGWLPARPAWWAAIVQGLGFEPRPEPDDLALMVVPFEWDPEEEFRRRLYYTKGDGDLF